MIVREGLAPGRVMWAAATGGEEGVGRRHNVPEVLERSQRCETGGGLLVYGPHERGVLGNPPTLQEVQS
jgi:hypothetical protein